VVACEDPKTGHWYITQASYVANLYVPTKIISAVESSVSHLNIMRRVSDPNSTWFIHQASTMGYNYIGVYNKKERKMELIKNLQGALGVRVFIAPWCSDLINEIMSCSWRDDDSGKIANASRFHLLDALQYLVDNLPKHEPTFTVHSWADRLIAQDAARQKSEIQSHRVRPMRRRRTW
jgi:hypothetical protein